MSMCSLNLGNDVEYVLELIVWCAFELLASFH